MRIAILLGFLVLTPAVVLAAALSDEQKAEVETIVRQLLTQKDPDIVAKAIEALQAKREAEDQAKAAGMIKDRWKDIYEDAEAPVTGNPKGDVTVVEFFDYQCGFCKRAHEETEKVLAEDKNLRYVYKQFPILGPNSLLAAKAAVAAHKQGKFLPLHTAFMKHKLPLTEEEINKLAKDVGLDVDKLKQDMESEPVVAYVNKSRELAESLGGRGTPLFVIGDKTYPGAMGTDQIKEILAGIRASATPKTP